MSINHHRMITFVKKMTKNYFNNTSKETLKLHYILFIPYRNIGWQCDSHKDFMEEHVSINHLDLTMYIHMWRSTCMQKSIFHMDKFGLAICNHRIRVSLGRACWMLSNKIKLKLYEISSMENSNISLKPLETMTLIFLKGCSKHGIMVEL